MFKWKSSLKTDRINFRSQKWAQKRNLRDETRTQVLTIRIGQIHAYWDCLVLIKIIPWVIYHRVNLQTFKKIFFIYFRQRTKEGRRGGRNIHVWLPLTWPPLGTWPTTQAWALTGNWTDDPLVLRPALNPLSHPSQGQDLQFSLESFIN